MRCRSTTSRIDRVRPGAAARDIAHAMLASYRPLAILTYQNNGVYSDRRCRVESRSSVRRLMQQLSSMRQSWSRIRQPLVRAPSGVRSAPAYSTEQLRAHRESAI